MLVIASFFVAVGPTPTSPKSRRSSNGGREPGGTVSCLPQEEIDEPKTRATKNARIADRCYTIAGSPVNVGTMKRRRIFAAGATFAALFFAALLFVPLPPLARPTSTVIETRDGKL